MTEDETVFCIECKTSVEQCSCVCPYCGKQKNNCFCNIMDTRDDIEFLSSKRSSKFNSFESPSRRIRGDDWWRLEKWQFGRRNFS